MAEHGIDLNAPSSANDAFGHAGVLLIDDDDQLPLETQQWDLIRNFMVICAGAASDAKITGMEIGEALSRQVSDHNVALQAL
ncbi:hypothetical protein [Alsobacter sp. SYSU BS001988]